MLRIWFIFIRISVPPSATPHGAVEWLDPTARTGEGYFTGSFMTATMSSTEFASTITLGCETILPNQFVTVFVAMNSSGLDKVRLAGKHQNQVGQNRRARDLAAMVRRCERSFHARIGLRARTLLICE